MIAFYHIILLINVSALTSGFVQELSAYHQPIVRRWKARNDRVFVLPRRSCGSILNASNRGAPRSHGGSSIWKFFKSIDSNNDGHFSVEEILSSPSQIVLERSSLAKSFLQNFKHFLRAITSKNMLGDMITEVKEVMSLFDFIVVMILIASHKRLLRMIYNCFHPNEKVDVSGVATPLPLPAHVLSSLGEINSDNIRLPAYQRSLIGSLERPISYLVWFPPILACIDVINVLFAKFGVDYHHREDTPRIISLVYNSVIIGSFITKVKDWALEKKRARDYARQMRLIKTLHEGRSPQMRKKLPTLERDFAKEAVTDEISSLICWIFIGISTMQAMSLEFGIALGIACLCVSPCVC